MNLSAPLAELLRPSNLDGFIGQKHIVGDGAVLMRAIKSGSLPSMILWGPPGVGKTTLAHIIANQLDRPFFVLSAVTSGVKDVRELIKRAKTTFQRPILFIDEIHRFSKSQQDSLLGAVERGVVTLIGATTENPSFEVISPLLSRCQVYILKSLDVPELESLRGMAVSHYKKVEKIEVEIAEKSALMRVSGGDARKLLNAFELVVGAENSSQCVITDQKVLSVIQENLAIYDKDGEQHYDIISAFIKSIRGSDPNGAVYWLARMLEGGEDPKFIARRLLILASEDIGNANPNALLLANACFDTVAKIGMPECRITLSQTTLYLASSAKSNASYEAINLAMRTVKETGDLSVPLPLRNSPTKLMKEIGYGNGYKYAHSYPNNFANMEFLPEKLSGKMFYNLGENPRENELRRHLKYLWKSKYDF